LDFGDFLMKKKRTTGSSVKRAVSMNILSGAIGGVGPWGTIGSSLGMLNMGPMIESSKVPVDKMVLKKTKKHSKK